MAWAIMMIEETTSRIDVEALKRRVAIEDAVQAWCPGIVLRRQGADLVGLSPFKDERTPSFTVSPSKGVWFCFATDQGGDAVRLVELLDGCPFPVAARRLADRMLGGTPMAHESLARAAERKRERERQRLDVERAEREAQVRRIRFAADIWQQASPGASSVVERYLEARGIDLDALAGLYGWRVPRGLRSARLATKDRHGREHVGPAMVGRLLDERGAFCGVHRTFLREDGSGKADDLDATKLTLGRVWGAHGELASLRDADHVVIGEGYETTLTVVSALARRGIRVACLSAISLGNLAGAGIGQGRPHPWAKGRRLPSVQPDPSRPGLILPPHVARVTILEDADGKDRFATRARTDRAAAKFRSAGLRVAIATPEAGCDFNDMIREAA
ncbi:MAG: CHC2 zinc finger domain-containing protein [Pseudomonadota bacterium]